MRQVSFDFITVLATIPTHSNRQHLTAVFSMMLSFAMVYLLLLAPNAPAANFPTLALIPVIVASLAYGVAGTVLIGIMGNALIIEFLPEHQIDANWWMRFTIFTCFGLCLAIPLQLSLFYQRRLHHVLMHDQGTGLPSRQALLKHLALSGQEHHHNALAVIKIDNMQDITATFGFEAADQMILGLWQALSLAFQQDTKVFHYHRERLAIFFSNTDPDLTAQILQVEKCFQQSILFHEIPIHFTAHLGFTTIKKQNRRQMINEAESAADYARELGIQTAIFVQQMTKNRKNDLILLGSLITGLTNGELSLHLQPKMQLSNRQVSSFEALARWQHPVLGPVAPNHFIPLIEKTELIHPFTTWVIEQALQIHCAWREQDHLCSFAVNISSQNLVQPGFAQQVAALLERYQVDSRFLELEITESELMKNPALAITLLGKLAAIGVTISIDDFGTGYSSLAYLHKLPASTIKIDRSFTQQLHLDNGARDILESTLQLAHRLGKSIVVEGIETAEQLQDLTQLQSDYGQGYFIARPMPAVQALSWLKQHSPSHKNNLDKANS